MNRQILSVVEKTADGTQVCQTKQASLQSLLDSSLDVICSIDADGKFTYVSAAAKHVWGYKPEELIGCKYMDLVVPADHSKTNAAAATIMSGIEVTSFENRYTKKDGSVVPILWSARWSAAEQLMYCVAKDAAEIQKAGEQKTQLAKRLHRACQLAEIAWWDYDVATQTYTSSDEIFSMYGLPIPENNQTTLEEFFAYVHPEDRAKLQHDLSLICQDTYVNYEHRVVKPTGEVIHVIHYSEVIRDERGYPVSIHGTTKDITERKLQQLQLEASEKRLQQYSQQLTEIIESIGNGFFTVDKEWTVTYWNRKAEELLAKRKEEIIGKNLWQVYESAIPLKFYTEYHRAVKEGIAVQFEEHFPPLNMWIEVAAYPSAEGLTVYFKDITDRKWNEDELKNSHERFALACRATNDIIWDWDIQNNKVLRSEGFSRYGYRPGELVSDAESWIEMIHPEDKDKVVESNRYAIQDGKTTYWEAEYRCRKSDGTYAIVVDKGCLVRDENGQAVRMVGAMKDITEQKMQENALQLANERFELVAKATSDALWDWDVLTNNCYFNEGFTALFGHENTADLVYKNWIDNIHEEDLKEVVDTLMESLNDTTINQRQSEYRFYRKDRTIAHVLDRGYIIRNGEGKAVRMVGSIQDITKLKEAEEEMQKLSLVAKETVNAVVITDAEEKITWVNKAFTDITEYSFEEALGKYPGELLQGPKTSKRTKRYLSKCVEKRLPFNCEILNYTKSGREYWLEIKGQPIFDETGELKHFFAIQTDITARKRAEAIIKLSEEKYKLLFHNSPMPKWIFHAETYKIVDVNEAACALYGYQREEFLQRRIQDLKRAEDELELMMSVQSLKKKTSGYFQGIVPHKKKNGEIFYIEIASCPIQLPTGVHLLVTGTDMTEKLQLQQKLIAEKVAAQKEIARAIIHAQETERGEIGRELHDNVCQLLTTAKLYIENINYMPEQQEEFTKKGIGLLMQSINEIRYLSRQLVSPVLSEAGFEASVNELINHYRSLNLFEICFSYGATMELEDKDLKISIIRILQEQFNNTVKYAKASVVEVSINNTEKELFLYFSDNGIGFDPHQVSKGIGLKNIQNRASAYRGMVNLTSAVGKGCTMEINFPLKAQADAFQLTTPIDNE